jgi:hypothetical protein
MPKPHSSSKRAIEPIHEIEPAPTTTEGQPNGEPPPRINWKEASEAYEKMGLGVAVLTVLTVGTMYVFPIHIYL